MMDCFTRNEPKEVERILRAQDDTYNEQFQYADNNIKTSKYNLLTFLPKNLLEQFTRVANAYFLFLLILQLIPVISSLTFVTTVIPLVVVLSVTALKDLIDDIQRHRSDRKINNRKCHLVRTGKLEEVVWKKIKVGDVLKVSSNELIPADLLLLTSSEASGIAFVETADLDGESNLKNKQSVPATSIMEDNLIALTEFDGWLNFEPHVTSCVSKAVANNNNGEVECEPPNNRINDFQGRMTWKGQRVALNRENILLRGCALKNTTWIFGVVLYAGKDSKLMMNCGKTIFKRTHIDRLMNQLIIRIFFFLILVCLICCIGSGVWESQRGFYFQKFLPWPSFIPGGSSNSTSLEVSGGASVTALLAFMSYVILFNTLVPISLYVSVEIIRFTQSWWINWDMEMIHEGASARARTTALNEELGQIQFIFSDKTGTLTQNTMCFKKCSINGRIYSEDEHQNASSMLDMSEKLRVGDEKVVEFFRVMSTCHTVLSTMEADKLVYQAQSPDESALVEASKKFGVVFRSRTYDSIIVQQLDHLENYQLLHIFDFNNDRKRMSVIVKRDNRLMLYCKGADSKIFERLKSGSSQLVEKTKSHLDEFAAEGLRTLCLACRELKSCEFDAWEKKFQLASTSLKNRNEMLDVIYDEIERDLDLLGATAIEDKLQGGVPETIENLRLAGIKIWVLTGDKQETAVNIGFSCKLLTEDLDELFVVDGETEELVEDQLHKMKVVMDDLKMAEELSKTSNPETPCSGAINGFLRKLLGLNVKASSIKESKEHSSNYAPKSNTFAIVVNGDSLTHALSPKLTSSFINIGCLCTSVICCRVTPLQKAKVVEAVKSIKKVVTLAVGDGANDVSMIKTAHIGVGISGQEGMQAVISSDYSMAQFRFLERLLLVHGRWSYLRMSKFLRYFFYKNFTFTFCQFWFAFYSGFSAQTIYDPFFVSLFNLAYTSLPIIALGVFDQDVSDKLSHSYPKLYHPGPHNLFFSAKLFALSAAEGVVTSFVVYYVTMMTVVTDDQELSDLHGVAFTISSTMVAVVTFRCSIETSYWTPFNHLVTWGSLVVFFIFHLVLYLPAIGYSYSGTFTRVASTVSYWSVILLSTAILILPVMCYRVYQSLVSTSLVHRIRELRQKSKSLVFPSEKQQDIPIAKSEELKTSSEQHRNSVEAETSKAVTFSRTSLRSSIRSRSSYAFSQEEGLGRLLTSGRVFKRKNQSNPPISG